MAKILIDADGCPVVDLALVLAKRFNWPVLLICDTSHEMHREGAETLTVSKGADAVDFVLVNRVEPGDIVVTQDYGLAAMVLAKRGVPIDQNGRVYNEGNIEQLLHGRHVAKKIRQSGGRMKGPKKRQQADNDKFRESLILLLES
ncbi:YaiI/YqxD family protein [Planococcus sp. CP5-4]|uniref:YaiI/YqxD family protein n=1 Tax=unclassified Planococcus (in: firmicutes) TaxID=2662419 RepID=UPI001C22A9C6|nr:MULTISPECIES: YaiI/YqxD family protein [unclassified Planococcus (in: firmicutes)]MBU9672447.1 YaiI/YqxD family protein [Planococcus sp. CP5-4_YE]MBV0909498.1 YaiI/YqxD family protein [Planococcus sp. CP5-4_UN]MBW6064227.1 YaiI/YqxD family protein [Planococcus sp. CP5-4]